IHIDNFTCLQKAILGRIVVLSKDYSGVQKLFLFQNSVSGQMDYLVLASSLLQIFLFCILSEKFFRRSHDPRDLMYLLLRFWKRLEYPSKTIVRYEITDSFSPAHATLEIFNLMGQKVGTLVSEMKKAGRYEVPWAGRDAQGNPVPSGMYVLHLQAGEQKASSRMVVVR
ncbi:MAG: T9SS type A sorting domain-containing protein, partial [Gemmatimonadota bacterium]